MNQSIAATLGVVLVAVVTTFGNYPASAVASGHSNIKAAFVKLSRPFSSSTQITFPQLSWLSSKALESGKTPEIEAARLLTAALAHPYFVSSYQPALEKFLAEGSARTVLANIAAEAQRLDKDPD